MTVIDDYKTAVNKYNTIHNTAGLADELNDVSQEITKEYYLFVIWLFITIIILILTMITVIYKNEVNPLVWIISIVFVLYCSFFIFKNIYNYTLYVGTG
jgi:hypothetical protein